MLWADDLVLISDSEKGMQQQLDGLIEFCSLNLMGVNEIKTKCMAVSSKGDIVMSLIFNNNDIEQVSIFKCLCVIVKSICKIKKICVRMIIHICVIRGGKLNLIFYIGCDLLPQFLSK